MNAHRSSRAPLACAAALAVLLAACGGSDPGPPAAQAPASAELRTGDAPGFPASSDHLKTPGRVPLADTGFAIDTTSRDAVRLFYKAVFSSSTTVDSGWSGSVAACSAGDTSAAFKAAALRRINWFRAMAGVPANVQFDATYSQKAQQAALLMSANNQLSHTPPSSWTCYSAVAAEAAGSSNLGIGSNGAATVEGYMLDPGSNNTVVGHRRWLLYPQTQFMGIGDVAGSVKANALWVFDANIRGARPATREDYVAWPPRGYVPYQAVYPRWSFAYPGADFSNATVSMTENGAPLATRLEAYAAGAGENTLVWLPGSYTDGMRWARPSADTVYNVTVSNVLVGGQPRSFSYSTTVFDADTAGGSGALALSGPAGPAVGTASAYTIAPWAGATGYQWRAIGAAGYALADSADQADTYFAASISAGYSAVVSGIAATGGNSYHLAHTQPVDQVLQLRATLVGRADSSLSFASRLALATSGQSALVEASTDEGASWTVLAQQAGNSVGETVFGTRSVSLAALAGKTFLLRFRYSASGTYFPQATAGVGWYIDDVRLANTDAVSAISGPFDSAGAAFSFTPPSAGERLLQARAGMYGFVGDWGPSLRVAATSAGAADCLFNWAERNYPQLFAPSGAASLTSAPYYYRFYSGTQAYLGTSSDGNLYYLKAGVLENVGLAATWYARAGCQ